MYALNQVMQQINFSSFFHHPFIHSFISCRMDSKKIDAEFHCALLTSNHFQTECIFDLKYISVQKSRRDNSIITHNHIMQFFGVIVILKLQILLLTQCIVSMPFVQGHTMAHSVSGRGNLYICIHSEIMRELYYIYSGCHFNH